MKEPLDAKDLWIELVEMSVKNGRDAISVPVSVIPKDKAIDLAVRLKVKLRTKGADYVFSRRKDIKRYPYLR